MYFIISVDSTFEDMRVSKLNSVSHCVDVLLYCHIRIIVFSF